MGAGRTIGWRNSLSHASDLSASERSAERSASRFKILEYLSAAVVFGGVIGEYVHPFVSSLPRVGLWLSFWYIGPGIAIALGIAAETLFSMLVSSREKTISSISAQRRVEAERKTAEILKEVAEANRLLEQERLARLKVEEALLKLKAPRNISGAMDEAIAILKPHGGLAVDIIAYDTNLPEVMMFEAAIEQLFNASGWNARPWHVSGGYRDYGRGITFTITVNREYHYLVDAIKQIVELFKREDVMAVWMPLGFTKDDIPGGDREEPFGFSRRWNPDDIAPLRIQITRKEIV